MNRTAFVSILSLGLALSLCAATPLLAGQPGPGAGRGGPRPPSVPAVRDPKAAPTGAYRLDGNHIAIVARLGHGNGISVSVFRFDTAKGTLAWDPANPSAIKIEVTVDPASVNTNVKGFAAEIAGEGLLNAAKFPEIKFVSTAFRPMGTTHAQVDGDFTFMGQTRPVTIDADLIGVGRAPVGRMSIGFSGTLKFKRTDYGLNALVGDIGEDVTVMLDGEFLQVPPPPPPAAL